MANKTKIVATLGPASGEIGVLERMIEAGMNVARINASHADAEAIRTQVELLRKAARNMGSGVGILLDLKGPKIRVGDIRGGETALREGQEFSLTTRQVDGDNRRVTVSNPDLPDALGPDKTVLLDDGALRLKVVDTTDTDVVCRVETGGVLKPRKGVNLPGTRLALSSVTEKDLAGLDLGLELGVDWVALSFVRSREDIVELREILRERNSDLPIVAKIEKQEALEDIEAVVEEADAVMVARGDLGVEMPLEEIPLLQKAIIAVCARLGKPVITATQMLESMTHNRTPTRAEVTDVANAVFDGTDAVMLSGESAVGRYPVETIGVMRRIIEWTETSIPYEGWLMERRQWVDSGLVEAVCYAACELALQTGASVIVAPTDSGFTAQRVSRFRPRQAILAPTTDERVARRLSLFWGIYPHLVEMQGSIEEMLAMAEKVVREAGLLPSGGTAVVTAGIKRAAERGSPTTNTIHCIKA